MSDHEQAFLFSSVWQSKESVFRSSAHTLHYWRNFYLHSTMNRKIGSNDMLSPNTPVRVGNRRGFIKKCETVPASNGGFISLHTVVFNEKVKTLTCSKKTWQKINPVESEVNYSFILF